MNMSDTNETQNEDNCPGSLMELAQNFELAQNALSEFQKGAYTSCLSYLNKLETLRPKDLKIMHNKVVVECYKNDLKKTELLRKSLNAICGQISMTDSTETTIDDIQKCVMRYNQAVLLYHTKQYSAALQIMNRLFAFIEPMEESLAHKVCLLLIELHIVTDQPDAALSLITYIESQLISIDNSKLASVDKEGIMKSVTEQKEQKKETDTAMDAFKIKLLKCKARIYLMMHQLKLCKREWKTFVSLGTPVNISTVFLKANLEYLRGNYKKAIKLLNSVTSENMDFKTTGESSAVLYYNNMACIHFAMGKPNLACFYLRKALRENKSALESVQSKDSDPLSSQPLYTLGGNRHYQLMYSLGVSLLHANQALAAFDCFMEAAQKLHNNPKLWLRVAECCIYCHKPTNEVDFNIPKRRKDLVQKVVGSGIHRKIILASSLSKDTKYHSESFPSAMPQLTLEFASLCLKNALFLLPSINELNELNVPITTITNSQSVPLSLTAGTSLGAQHSAPVSQVSTVEALNLKVNVLAANAYVCLCLGDYVVALEHAKSLLSINKLPGAYKMLGNLYAAESLIFMDKISEAIEYLKPENIQDLSTFVPIPDTQDKDRGDEVVAKPLKTWYPTTVPTGIAVLRYNLAVAYAIRGELDKSGETLKEVWMSKGPECDVPIHVIMLALYIELQLGHADISRSIIKQHCPQYR
ncbi:CCR4-NOT transcription complex subunit 10 [Megalopta genalis]|uniref:CCR4-NOT transcription complex subunit 10 n=1 Tax=Megalopta genalis TaxID=115081 RepID=UPI003FD4BA03